MTIENKEKSWRADLYLRLSKEDKDKSESNSIKNQRELLLDFISRNPDIQVVDILIDDGYTGANFDRDAFKEMIRHIEDGSVDCVIVKDFSRLGRDHIETGKYIERYFAQKKTRFIAVNEQYDSLKADMSDTNNSLIVPFKNIINEAFLEDISVKTKTQLEIKRKNGELVCNFAAYGYVKLDGKLIVDDYAADVVKQIFDCKISGYSEGKIAEMLNTKGVLSPAEYKGAVGTNYQTPFGKSDKALWSPNAIKRILTNRVYLGYLEQGKRSKTSYRMKKYHYKPRESWIVHEDAHENIIDKLDFELVQELLAMDTRIAEGSKTLHLFSGFIVCGECGQPMTVKTVKKNGRSYVNYICSTHKKTGDCINNNISELELRKVVLLIIRSQIAFLMLPGEAAAGITATVLRGRKQAAIESMIDRNIRIIKDNGEYLVTSYKHLVDGIISEDEYRLFKENFNNQIQIAETGIGNLQKELSRLEDDVIAKKMIERFLEHSNITELDRRVVAGLIKSITIDAKKDIHVMFRYENGFSENTSEFEPYSTDMEKEVA